MTTEQQRKMLEAAAKACGLIVRFSTMANGDVSGPWVNNSGWNPLLYPADTAEMCAKLGINTFYYMALPKVECSLEDAGDEQVIRYSVGYADNPGEKLRAWMFAATMVAAKIGGYEDA